MSRRSAVYRVITHPTPDSELLFFKQKGARNFVFIISCHGHAIASKQRQAVTLKPGNRYKEHRCLHCRMWESSSSPYYQAYQNRHVGRVRMIVRQHATQAAITRSLRYSAPSPSRSRVDFTHCSHSYQWVWVTLYQRFHELNHGKMIGEHFLYDRAYVETLH